MGQKAAIYCRVSTAEQSYERQEQDLIAYAERCGHEVVGIWKETASGSKQERPERKKIMALAQARKINVILVTELTRWGRGTLDLVHSLQDLQAYNVSIVAQTGVHFDLSTAQGKMMASVMSVLAEFEKDLLRERVKSGIAAAQARGQQFGRRQGQRVKADKVKNKVIALIQEGYPYRQIGKMLDISKNTVLSIMKRERDIEKA